MKAISRFATPLVFALTLAGCGDDTVKSSICPGGETTPCTCFDGREGTSKCGSGGYGSCICTGDVVTFNDVRDTSPELPPPDTEVSPQDTQDTGNDLAETEVSCCTQALCQSFGQICNTATCQCEAAPCCTQAQCQATGKTCNTTTCLCESAPCCTQAECSAISQTCNTTTCLCETPACCTQAQCQASGQTCNTSTCQCEAPACCTQAECSFWGQDCNTTSCQCEDPVCTVVGEVCDPFASQPSGWTCVDDGFFGGTCAESCTTVGGDSCTPGSVCLSSVCEPSDCTHFFYDDCGLSDKCVPVGNDAYFCFTAGYGAEGSACTSHSDCDFGLLCVGSVCTAPNCTALSSMETCATGNCAGWWIGSDPVDVGICDNTCLAFDSSVCPAGQFCDPGTRDVGTGEIMGACAQSGGGTAQPGTLCTNANAATTCVDSAVCINTGTQDECVTRCDPDSATTGLGACAVGEHCGGVVDGTGNALDWGICLADCAPWLSDPVAAGCLSTEVCDPDWYTRGIGACGAPSTGLALLSEACDNNTPATTCEQGLLCVGGTCETLCDPAATGTEPGQCGAGLGCSGLVINQGGVDIDLAIGMCVPSCGFVHGDRFNPTIPCPGSEICQPGELAGTLFDYCQSSYNAAFTAPPLAEGATCPVGTEWSFCRPGGACVDLTGVTVGLECREFCLTSNGAFGSSAHPDCSNPAAICLDAFGATDLGVCD